jgi:hypothetical protein
MHLRPPRKYVSDTLPATGGPAPAIWLAKSSSLITRLMKLFSPRSRQVPNHRTRLQVKVVNPPPEGLVVGHDEVAPLLAKGILPAPESAVFHRQAFI